MPFWTMWERQPAFRVGPNDAEALEKDFAPELRAADLIGLPNHHIYMKLMIYCAYHYAGNDA